MSQNLNKSRFTNKYPAGVRRVGSELKGILTVVRVPLDTGSSGEGWRNYDRPNTGVEPANM